ncbi:Transport and Golgi organization protein 1 [Eufriesea mexicana]|uniref:Transport and Golgi organization protein 1 n=1 Tax=Eufriesea mexicana TaxID=516756 RepID=A0A310SNI6_9HYME|nr:Transport and Golgi organization protein 1 [Eufriesea mexicana]
MTEKNLFINVLFLVIAIIFSLISQCSSVLSDKRLCYDPDCSVPVSLARTTLTYTPNEAGLLSVNIGDEVTVYSKEAGKRNDLWGVEIKGKHGFISKTFLKEYKILQKDLKYEVPIDPLSGNNVQSNKKFQSKKNKNKSVFDNKDIKTTKIQDNHNKPFMKPYFMKEIKEAMVVPNKKAAVDEATVDKATHDKLQNKEQAVLTKVDHDFLTNSEEKLNLSNTSGIHSSSLNISTISNKEDYTKENVKNNFITNVKDNKSLKVIDTINFQTPTDSKKTLNIETKEIVDLSEEHNVNSHETIIDSDIKSDMQNALSSDKIDTNNKKATEKDIKIVASNDAGDVQNVKNFDETETKNIQTSEDVTVGESNDTRLDKQNIESSDKSEKKEIRSSQSVTLITTNDTKSDVESVASSDKIEVNNDKPSEKNETNDTTLDKQNIESFDKSETKAIQSSQSVTLIMTNDTKSDVESAVISDKIEVNNKPSESVTIDVTDIKSEEQNAESSNNFETKDIPLLESIVVHKNDIQHLENVTELEIVEYKLKEDEENENTEDSNKLGNDKYNSPLSFESIFQNEVSMTSPTENIETKNIQFFKNIAGQYGATESDPKSSSDIEDTMNQSNLDVHFDSNSGDISSETGAISENNFHKTSFSNVCRADNIECSSEDIQNDFPHHEQNFQDDEVQTESNYWLTLMYLSVTATATLIFSLGYYCIENMRSDRQLIARINKLEKDLLISEAECSMVNENLKSTKRKLSCMEDESFGSDEMVLSLRADLEASQNAKAELEDQVAMLEKDLESATEAGLELEKMLREFLSSNNEVNPLAQSVEDLQTRLNVQQAANESLTNALNLKTQENESLSVELASIKKKYEELEVELIRVTENLKLEINSKNSVEQMLTDKVQQLEMQIKEISTEKATLQKELKGKEVEVKDLVDIINRTNSNNLDLDKLYDVSHIKAEATTLLEERNELKIRLAEVEGAHDLLEEHVKVVKEEIATLSEQCKIAEKEKKDAETRLEVLTNFFEEKEAQRQKEEAIWLQQQGEVVSTVERIQAMQNEIQNYKQQTEVLKREILDQEREYKNQISLFETKAHEQWVIARQVERRLEESKVEAGQLRNRLTLIEKNINDVDPEAKLHRLEANGETTTSPPLFIGAESSSSPIMFSGSSSVPPPPPYLHSLFTPYLPLPLPNTSGVPPYEVSQRPPPLGGRLSSPPPMPLHPPASRGYENAGSPPPMSPHLLPPFNHRSPPPPFGSDIHPPPPPPPGSILPPPLGTQHSWGEESLPPPRNSGFHPTQRERVRNHKGLCIR